jgi:hypothetical protein
MADSVYPEKVDPVIEMNPTRNTSGALHSENEVLQISTEKAVLSGPSENTARRKPENVHPTRKKLPALVLSTARALAFSPASKTQFTKAAGLRSCDFSWSWSVLLTK